MTLPKPARPAWIHWALLAVLIVLVWALYPQLMDFGGELYRFFS